MARTSHSAGVERFRAEARHALERLRHYRQQGDAGQCERWHQAWSLAQHATDAELRERGGGARILRLKNPPPLRPLPADVSPLAAQGNLFGDEDGPVNPLATPVLPPALSGPEPATAPSTEPANGPGLLGEDADPLPGLLLRHGRIERALREGGPNPLPDELEEGEWQYHLAAYQDFGPGECELLQAAEEAVEAVVEFRPEYWEWREEELGAEGLDDPAAPGDLSQATLPRCIQVYQESLPELTEEELLQDLDLCGLAGRDDTRALIEAELARREREPTAGPRQAPPKVEAKQEWLAVPRPGYGADAVCDGEGELPGAEVLRSCVYPRPIRSRVPRKAKASAVADRTPAVGTARASREEPDTVLQPAPSSAYTTAPAWIDTAGRTRTWSLLTPDGEKLAEITTKRDADKLARLLDDFLRQLGGQGE